MSADGRGTPRWYDDDAGPVVRPYAMTRGRTSSVYQHRIDLIALVMTEEDVGDLEDEESLSPEHLYIVDTCRKSPQSVADLSAGLNLPVGVVRVLVGDLLAAELVLVSRPVPPAELPDESILRDVIEGLRAL